MLNRKENRSDEWNHMNCELLFNANPTRQDPEWEDDEIEEYVVYRHQWESRNSDEDDAIPSYLNRLTQAELLSSEEENELSVKARSGNEDAQRRLVEANMRLVINIAKHYRNRTIPFEDLVQEGAIGLMNAIKRYDPTKGYRFSTYATHWIRQAIGRAIDNKSKAIRLPAHVIETMRRIEKERTRLKRELNTDPTPEQLAEASGVSIRKVLYLMQTAQDPISLDVLIGEEDGASLGAMLSDDKTSDPENMVLDIEMQTELADIFASLNEQEQMVMRRRLGFEDDEAHVLQDIGRDLQLSRERIRQIENQAIKKMRMLAHRRRLRDLFMR